MTDRTIPVTFVRSAVEIGNSRGVDMAGALRSAGISPALLGDDRARCTPGQVTTLVREFWRLSDDEFFGLGAMPVPRGTFRLICYALITSPDLLTLCRRLTDFAPALPMLPRFTLTVGPSTTRLEAHLDGVQDPHHLMTDFMLLLIHRFTGWLIGKRIKLEVVELPYEQPENAAEYDLIFGAPIQFGHPSAALVLDSKLLPLPIIRDERELDEYLKHSPADLLGRRDYGTTMADQVRRILERGLRGPWPSSEDVAARLSLSPQHVRRLLRDEGTSLGAIKEELLRDAAISALARGDAVDDISARLGFSEPSAFRRAFKRWTGATPAAYQAAP
ncbi:AraC family transcriptional regulator [Jatrophihabitans sp.]|uniref:AraC family transcriptional regulator n=1 Tax=Jatrophihabitans sp. TaxID=1932789 RepID=UPI0030C7084F|nr:AraC family transcriptional regulator [Jatrophihabitans sp.]